jgi:pimeloyl-ACP methyl ester carboxylesterase
VSATPNVDLDVILDAFERVGGRYAREVARRRHVEPNAENLAEYLRVCVPLYAESGFAVERTKRGIYRETVRAYFARTQERNFDLRPRLARIARPTLVITGADDPICPPADSQRIVSGLRPGVGRLLVVPGARHGVVDDLPTLFSAITAFMHELGPTLVGA